MPPEEILTAPVATSDGNEIPSTETQPPAQAPAEPQTATTIPVENGSNTPQIAETPRRKPSDFYRDRQRVRNLEEQIASQNKKYEELAALIKKEKETGVPPPDVPLDHSLINVDPDKYLSMRERKLMDRLEALEGRLESDKRNQEVTQKNQKSLEALEKLFPKSSPDSRETLAERVNKDPERAERIKLLIAEDGLDNLDPEKAAKYILKELGEAKKPNPTVLNKTLMGGVSTGNPGAGDKRAVSEADLRSENKKMNDQLDQNQALRFDEKFMERKRQVMDSLMRLVTKK